MRQQSEAHPRGDARSDPRAPAAHGTGDALPAPFGRLFPDLASGPPPTPDDTCTRPTTDSGAAMGPATSPTDTDGPTDARTTADDTCTRPTTGSGAVTGPATTATDTHGPTDVRTTADREAGGGSGSWTGSGPPTDLHAPTDVPAPTDAEADRGFARLVAHDLGIVADPATGVLAVPAAAPPTLALDGLYGPGPFDAPQLYDPSDRARLRRPDRPGPCRDLAAAHGAEVDAVRAGGLVFWPVVLSAARRRVVHRYQRTVLDELLPRWVGPSLVDAILRHGRRFYRPADTPFVPLELLALAPWLVPTHAPARPCPAAWTLPPGRDVARALDVAPLAPTDLDPDTPLDDYVVAESRIVAGGRRLGPVGGRILAEVVIGVLELDVDSCLGPLAPVTRTPGPPPSPGPGPRSSRRPARS